MRLEKAVAGAIANAEVGAQALTVTEFAEQLGGTRAAAEQLGVSMRTVQRYIKGESGEPGQTRKPSAAVRGKLEEAAKQHARAATIAEMRAKGIKASVSGIIRVSQKPREREINDVYMSGDEIADMLDAYEERHMQKAAGAFDSAFADAYGVNGMTIEDVDDLSIEIA